METLPFELLYLSLFGYSPRDNSQIAQKSRDLKSHVKAGRIETIRKAVSFCNDLEPNEYNEFLNSNVTLVPIPGSSLFLEGAVRPPALISQALYEAGLAYNVADILYRDHAVPKSSNFFTSDERPLFTTHYNSFRLRTSLHITQDITLVDDILTMGRTAYGAALRLIEAYPNAKIRLFSLQRTPYNKSISELLSVERGVIIAYPSGKTYIPID